MIFDIEILGCRATSNGTFKRKTIYAVCLARKKCFDIRLNLDIFLQLLNFSCSNVSNISERAFLCNKSWPDHKRTINSNLNTLNHISKIKSEKQLIQRNWILNKGSQSTPCDNMKQTEKKLHQEQVHRPAVKAKQATK